MAKLIQFVSKVEDERMKVVVYAKNFSLHSARSRNENCVIWQLLSVNKDSEFRYSNQLQIASEYRSLGMVVKNGPFPVKHGSTWKITFNKRDDVAMLEEVATDKPHLNGKILLQYKKPSGWNGCPFDIKIYRSGDLHLFHPNLRPGKEIEFLLPSKLFFGIVYQNFSAGQVVNTLSDVRCETELDLSCYPRGVQVSAEQISATDISFKFLPLM